MERKIIFALFLFSCAWACSGDSLTGLFSLSVKHDQRLVSGENLTRFTGNFGDQLDFVSGTSTTTAEIDAVYSVRGSVTSTTPDLYDLRNLANAQGAALSFALVKTFGVRNISSFSISVGGSWIATETLGSQGILLQSSPLSGFSVGAAASSFTVSVGSGPAEYDLLILGVKN